MWSPPGKLSPTLPRHFDPERSRRQPDIYDHRYGGRRHDHDSEQQRHETGSDQRDRQGQHSMSKTLSKKIGPSFFRRVLASRAGFTLIEVLVAVSIFAFGMLGL